MIPITPDTRPLHVRVRALANRYDAIATGCRKDIRRSVQDVANAERDAGMLHDAADALEKLG